MKALSCRTGSGKAWTTSLTSILSYGIPAPKEGIVEAIGWSSRAAVFLFEFFFLAVSGLPLLQVQCCIRAVPGSWIEDCLLPTVVQECESFDLPL